MYATHTIVLTAGLLITASTLADVAPGGWVDARIVGSMLEMRDTSDDHALIARQGLSLLGGFPVGIVSDTHVTPAIDGADLLFTFRNTSASPKKLGRIYTGILNLGQDIQYFNFRHTSIATDAHAGTHIGWAAMYPDDLYSPVAVLKNDHMAVGVSLQYPVMEYKHDVRIEIDSPGSYMAEGDAGRGWFVSFGLSNIGQEGPYSTMQYEALLQPGEERTYTLNIRFTKNPQEWQQTLVPYRDFFRATYGPVKYQRQTSPVLAYAMADAGYISAINPLGYRPNHRPDLNGFGGVIRELSHYDRWPTIMLWAPTGLYRNNQELNWPYQCASHWNTTPQQRTAFAPEGFPSIAAGGQEIGLWWGRSLGLASHWDTTEYTHFDPANQEQRHIAFAELDAAVQAGATWIGLDTFAHNVTPIWKSRDWLRDMQARHPGLHFVTEPSMCDIMHVECPTFMSGWNAVTARPSSRAGLFNINNPDYLADFLLPGHETWGAFRYSEHKRFFGEPTSAQVRADMERFASMGYRPCFGAEFFTPQNIDAAPSWDTSVPASIRSGDQWIADIREGRRPGQSPTGDAGDPPPNQGNGNPPPVVGGDAPGSGGGAAIAPTNRPRPGSQVPPSNLSNQRSRYVRVIPQGTSTPPPSDPLPTTPTPQGSSGNSGGSGNAGTGRMSSNFRDLFRRRNVVRVQRPPAHIDRVRERAEEANADSGN